MAGTKGTSHFDQDALDGIAMSATAFPLFFPEGKLGWAHSITGRAVSLASFFFEAADLFLFSIRGRRPAAAVTSTARPRHPSTSRPAHNGDDAEEEVLQLIHPCTVDCARAVRH